MSSSCSLWDGVKVLMDGMGASASTPYTSWVGGRVGNCREGPGIQSGLKGKAAGARMGCRKCAVASL